MVTIEQKLTLFSKLLNQDLKEEIEKKSAELESEYGKILMAHKEEIDREALEIVEQAKRRAETKKLELISKGKMSSKKEAMLVKEKYINRFIKALEAKVDAFTLTTDYEAYLVREVASLIELKGYENNLEVYVTNRDFERHQGLIKKELIALGINEEMIDFKRCEMPILGGFIIQDPIMNMRIDGSMKSAIEDAKGQIVELITTKLEGVGDTNE